MKLFIAFLLSLPMATSQIQDDINKRVDLHYNQHIVVAHLHDNTISFHHAGDFPHSPEEMVFEIGSLTKLFTAHLTLLLDREKTISLDETIEKHLPENVKVPRCQGQPITITHLLTHSSGIKDPETVNYYNPETGNTVRSAEYSVEDLYTHLNHLELLQPPGSKLLYTNLGYGLLGHILERASGKDYFTLLKEKILDPLKMDQTFYHVPEDHATNKIEGLEWQISHLPAFGALKSTAKDLAIYLQALFVEEKDLGKLIEPYLEFETMPITATRGLTIDRRYGGYTYAAGGRTLGFSCFFGFSPKKKEGVVLLTDASSLDELGHHWLNPKFPTQTLYKAISMSQNELKKYEGQYCNPQETEPISVKAENGYLELRSPGEPSLRLFPCGDNKFFSRYFDPSNGLIQFDVKGNKRMQLKFVSPTGNSYNFELVN